MIRIAVCDDDKHILNNMKKLLEYYFQTSLNKYSIDYYNNGNELLNSKTAYDILFLDIEMGEPNGIEVSKKIQKENADCFIFFITSHEGFMDDALDTRPFRYLRKPVDEKRMYSALDSALNKMRDNKKFIIVSSKKEKLKIFINDIVYVTIQNRKSLIVTKERKIEADDKFQDIKDVLPDLIFAASHKSYYVNLGYVFKYNTKNVILKFGDKTEIIDISRRNYKGFHAKFFEYARDRF